MSSIPTDSPPTLIEGQSIASALLASLETGQNPDWTCFLATYKRILLCRAVHWVQCYHLERIADPEDIVQAFLAERIYPPARARVMFQRTAQGLRPLRPILLLSLRNFCLDLLAHEHLDRRQALSDDDDPLTPGTSRELTEEQLGILSERLAGMLHAIRSRHGVDVYRGALLVRLRLEMVPLFRWNSSTLESIEELLQWLPEELGFRFVTEGRTMAEIWQAMRERLESPEMDYGLSTQEQAELIPVPRDRWNQWFSRGTRRLRESLSHEEWDALFEAIWPG